MKAKWACIPLLLALCMIMILAGCSDDSQPAATSNPAPSGEATEPETDYFAGKTVKLIVPYSPGGTYDFMARLVSDYLPNYLPGGPSVIVENQPGGGGMLGIRNIFDADPDGLTIGHFESSVIFQQVLELDDYITFESFPVIGSTGGQTKVLMQSSDITLEDVKTGTTVKYGGIGPGNSFNISTLIADAIMGLEQLQVVQGYNGASDIFLAVNQGELHGAAIALIDYDKNPTIKELIDTGKSKIVLVIGGEEPHERYNPLLDEVPQLKDLAETEEHRNILNAFSGILKNGRIFLTSPGVPEDVVTLYREAFNQVMKDPEFLAKAVDAGFEINVNEGEQAQEEFRAVLQLPDPEKEYLKTILLE